MAIPLFKVEPLWKNKLKERLRNNADLYFSMPGFTIKNQ
jgi:hypothetical protein